jgi:hypothetical protein
LYHWQISYQWKKSYTSLFHSSQFYIVLMCLRTVGDWNHSFFNTLYLHILFSSSELSFLNVFDYLPDLVLSIDYGSYFMTLLFFFNFEFVIKFLGLVNSIVFWNSPSVSVFLWSHSSREKYLYLWIQLIPIFVRLVISCLLVLLLLKWSFPDHHSQPKGVCEFNLYIRESLCPLPVISDK